MNRTIGFIGTGNMGSAIIGGVVKSQMVTPGNIFVYDKNIKVAEETGKIYGVKCVNLKEVCSADIIFLAVKPNVIYGVINEIKDYIHPDKVIVSIAAGQSIERLEKAFSITGLSVVRVMPNTPALVGEGMSAVSFNQYAESDETAKDDIISILNCVGKTEIVTESLMDAVTGVSGSSPAYVFMLIEAMADAAVLGGMPRKQAYTFAAQAVLGSAKMVFETEKHPGELKDMVCSPSGTTIEAVKVLEEKGFRSAVIDAISACIDKSKNI